MNNWTREQTIIALNVYCKIPFNKATNNNQTIINAAKLIGRSINAVKMKVGNFGSFDPELRKQGIVGLSGTSKLDKEIWEEYYNHWDKLAYDSEMIIANLLHKSIEESSGIDIENLPNGEEREVIVKRRINQMFFRNTVLSSYNNKCCITGLACTDMLEACHIADWSADIKNRLNPTNGICLNSLFHKAYDKNYLGITPDYKIVISDRLYEENQDELKIIDFFFQYNKKQIILPNRFLPNKELLESHYQKFLEY